MSIEKDLQQKKPFKNEYQRSFVNLLFTSRYVETIISKEYKKYGLTLKQYNILRILRGAGKPISTQLIRERMIDRMSDISRIVDRMVAKEFVIKCVNEEDKRLVDVSLSEKGLKLLEDMQALDADNDRILGNLTNEECIELTRILDKIRGYN